MQQRLFRQLQCAPHRDNRRGSLAGAAAVYLPHRADCQAALSAINPCSSKCWPYLRTARARPHPRAGAAGRHHGSRTGRVGRAAPAAPARRPALGTPAAPPAPPGAGTGQGQASSLSEQNNQLPAAAGKAGQLEQERAVRANKLAGVLPLLPGPLLHGAPAHLLLALLWQPRAAPGRGRLCRDGTLRLLGGGIIGGRGAATRGPPPARLADEVHRGVVAIVLLPALA